MTHTTASRLYRKHRIPGHPVQMACIARVYLYLLTRYGNTPEHRERITRHQAWVIRACR